MQSITWDMVKECFSPRRPDSHKGTYGQVLAVCGSYGMAGAAMLCARGALHSGAGLVRVALPRSVYPLIASAVPEAVFSPLAEDAHGRLSQSSADALHALVSQADALVVGCGLGVGEDMPDLILDLCRHRRCPMILDADGINAIKPHMLIEETVPAPLIMTPHPGEMARLLGISVGEVQQQRAAIAQRFATDHGVILVLKGHRTLIAAPDRPLLENPTGNAGMATGGSGDVLAGMIGALVAQGMDPYDAAMCGVYLHGAAGDAAAARCSQHSMLPSDLIRELGGLFLKLEK